MSAVTRILTLAVSLLPASMTAQELLTVAERSNWEATGYHKDVVAFVDALAAKAKDVVRVVPFGKSHLGKTIPMLVIADPPVASAKEARASGKLVVYAQGGIHSGECCGKEALQMLARDIVTAKERPLLEKLVIVFVPLYNADGNDRMRKTNRPGQKGPVQGMGIRPNAQGYDLNRDNTKIESPEAQALTRFMTEWDPALFIDTHTTNGSYHQNTLTFDGPVHPAGDRAIIDFVRNTLLPSIRASVKKATGYKTTYYGNSDRQKKRWTTYPGQPRFGTRARGIRGVVSVLTEAYKYAEYKDRILCTKAFVEQLLLHAAANVATYRKLYADVRGRTVARGKTLAADDLVPLQVKVARLPQDILIEGWVEKVPEGGSSRRRFGRRAVPTEEKKNYTMEHWGGYESTLAVRRPFAYVYPARFAKLTAKLRQHGIPVETLESEQAAELEIYRVTKVQKARRSFQKHLMNTIDAEARAVKGAVPKGYCLVRTAHHLGNLIVYLLEPQAEDGLASWNYLDEALAEGQDFPVQRVMKPFGG